MRIPGGAFPGDRRVWQVGALVLGLICLLVGWQLVKPREVLLGSNGVAPRNNGSEVLSGQQVCASRIRVPSGAEQVRWSFDTRTAGKPQLAVQVRVWETSQRRGANPIVLSGVRPAAPGEPGLRYVDLPLNRAVPDGPYNERIADICVTPKGGSVFPWGNAQSGNTDRPLTIDGKVAPDAGFRPTLQFLGAKGSNKAMILRPNAIFERMSLFRPGFVGPWTYWLIFLLVLPGLAYGGLHILAGAEKRSIRRTATAVYSITVAIGCTWALVTPTFQTPDETEHFAAVQYVAETGRAVDPAPNPKRPVPWSTEEAYAIDATHTLPLIESNLAKLPWPAGYERAWERANKNGGKGLPQDDGGGYHPATSAHSPAYYALLSPGYRIAQNHSPFAQLLTMRWENALLAAFVALFAFLAALELMPGRRLFAASAGLVVGFQPMFGFMAGAVNNDTGVNAAAAGLVWLSLRGLRRGLTWQVGAGIGVLLAVAPIMKGTGYELFPPVALALLFMLWRGRRVRAAWAGLVAQLVAFAAVTAAWAQIATSFQRDVFTTPGGSSPTGVAGLTDIPGYLSWMWQVLVPIYKLPGMTDLTQVRWPFFTVYIKRGFGSFGWYAIEFPHWVYLVIAAVGVTLLAVGAIFIIRRRDLLRRHVPELLFLMAVPVTVVFAVEAAYVNLSNIPFNGTPEQGRYGFTALAALAVITAGCCRAFGEQRGTRVAAGIVAALIGLTIAGQVMMVQRFYA